jgi:hypothetical protein
LRPAAPSEHSWHRLGVVDQDQGERFYTEVLGFQAAILYDTVGPALLATLEPDQFQSTLQLDVHFLRPVRPGRITGKGRVVHRDGTWCTWRPRCWTPTGRWSPPPVPPPG